MHRLPCIPLELGLAEPLRRWPGHFRRCTMNSRDKSRGGGTHVRFRRWYWGAEIVGARDYMEHRWGYRQDVSRPVHLGTRGGLAARGTIRNVSISGAFVVSSLPVPLFSHVRVQFTAMLDGQRTAMVLEAQVVRRDDTGVGVEWCEFAPDAVRALMMVPPFRAGDAPHGEWDVARPRRARIATHKRS